MEVRIRFLEDWLQCLATPASQPQLLASVAQVSLAASNSTVVPE